MNRYSIVIIIVVILSFVLGCTTGSNPVVPDPGSGLTSGVQGLYKQSNTHLWGYWDCYVNTETWTIEFVENRAAMFTANVTNFLNSNPFSMMFNINGIITGPDYIDVDIDVGLTHPFPGMPQYNGYDVRGVFMGDGSFNMGYNNALIYPVFGTDQFMFPDPVDDNGGPDGYTRWFNISEFSGAGMPLLQYTQGNLATPGFSGNSTLNPYRYFADGLGTNGDLTDWLDQYSDQHGQFSSGATNERNYYLRFPNAKDVVYGYAVIANWEGDTPEFHPSNAVEAVASSVVDNSDVWYVDPLQNGGDINLELSIFDWHAEVSAGVMEDYKIFVESTVLSIPYECNALEMTPVGQDGYIHRYQLGIPADAVMQLEGNEYWVIVESTVADHTNEFGIPNDAGVDPLAGFFRFDLDVSNQLPCGVTLEYMDPDTAGINESVGVQIVGTGFSDGPSLGCYLSNGSINVTGDNIAVIDPALVQADFDFLAAGAEEGFYDLYYTNGDSCEVMLADAMELVDTSWPVLVESSTNYYYPKFIEDSNGIYHIICSSAPSPPESGNYPVVESVWFISEDSGYTWENKGNIWTWAHTVYGTAPTNGHAMAADANGGVYVSLPERPHPSTSFNDMYVAYLDTDSLGDPSTWTVNDWDHKHVIDGYVQISYICASPDGELLMICRLSTANCPYIYAQSWASLPPLPGPVQNMVSKCVGITPREMVQSPNNAIVYDETKETFILAMGGLFDWNYSTSPPQVDGGGFLLEYDPLQDQFNRLATISHHFDTVYGLGGSGRFDKPYFGDVTLDSNGAIHWVHQIQVPTNEPTSYYYLGYSQYTFGYATNASGSWDVDLPINPTPTFYVNPDPPDPTNPNFQRDYERRSVNLVCNSSDTLIMSLESSYNNKDFDVANDSTGGFTDPPVIYQDHSTGDHPPWHVGQGEASGTLLVIPFTSQDSLNWSVNGSLYFTKLTGN